MNETVSKRVEDFFTQFKHQLYKKGEILIRADDDPPGIFYLKEGVVKMYMISRKGDEVVLNIFKPNSFFPMSWAINDTQNIYFFEAITEVHTYRVSKEEAVEFIKNNPDVMYDLLKRMYIGTERLLTRMAYTMRGNAYSQLLIELIIHVKRFGTAEKNNSYSVTTTETELGTHTGITRETVSREMKILKKKRLVTFEKNRLVIKDLKKLEDELGSF